MTNPEKLDIIKAINTNEYGKGSAKTVDHLITEIELGETILTRNIKCLYINVFYVDQEGEKYKLVEEKQVFKDGRTRVRNLSTSLGEKIKPNENIDEALIRSLQEELNLHFKYKKDYLGETRDERDSTSYPGLITASTNHLFDVYIDNRDYNADGYIEHQPDKTNFYIWQKITD